MLAIIRDSQRRMHKERDLARKQLKITTDALQYIVGYLIFTVRDDGLTSIGNVNVLKYRAKEALDEVKEVEDESKRKETLR